jgi:hypothetical protein
MTEHQIGGLIFVVIVVAGLVIVRHLYETL